MEGFLEHCSLFTLKHDCLFHPLSLGGRCCCDFNFKEEETDSEGEVMEEIVEFNLKHI